MATSGGASVDHMTGPIAILIVANIGVILLLHAVFDVITAATAPASAGVQQRRASTTVNRAAANYTPLAYGTLPFTRADHRRRDLSAEAPRLRTTATNRAVAIHQSGSNPINDTANTLTPGCR
ncbi:MAG: hypothetical protein J2P17_24120 [Mycobacterium sp.]|nr:hypothetical protein [Mycobacterium sp.]